jgi:hypothetical protein
VTKLLTHVLSGESRSSFWHCGDAIALADRLTAAGSDSGPLWEQLLRLHCRGAMD